MEYELKEKFDYILKFIIIGDTKVGKSSILHNFLHNKFLSNSAHTLGVEFGSKFIEVNEKTIKLQIWDTAG
jgi:small GTP-binding protein